MNTTTETKQKVCMPPTMLLRRPRHALLMDWEQVSQWIGQTLHTSKRLKSILSAFDLRPLLLPLGIMIAILGLLAAVLPPLEQMRPRPTQMPGLRVQVQPRRIGELRIESLPDGRVVAVTFRGPVKDLPKSAEIGDEFESGGGQWIWITPPGATHPAWVDP